MILLFTGNSDLHRKLFGSVAGFIVIGFVGGAVVNKIPRYVEYINTTDDKYMINITDLIKQLRKTWVIRFV